MDTSSDFAKGWSVVRVAIPSTGNIGHAFVDLKSAAGREFTLSEGVVSQEGVTLGTVEWFGSPVRAKVVLRKGRERAELIADASLVTRDDILRRREAQVEIEAQFFEISKAVSDQLGKTGADAHLRAIFAPRNPANGMLSIRGVLDPQDAEALLARLAKEKGVEFLSTPKVTTRSQQHAVIEIIREFPYPTEFERDEKKEGRPLVPTSYETRNCGVTLEVLPVLDENDVIDLTLQPKVVEFLGFISYPSGKTMPVQRGRARTFEERLTSFEVPSEPIGKDEIRQPVFSTRTTKTSASIKPGQTVVFFESKSEDGIKNELNAPVQDRQLLVLVRARMTQEGGGKRATDQPPEPAVSADSDVPFATPVPNNAGFITSPHAPDAGYIDVRGLPSGKEVKCPYTGKMFRVP